MAETTEPAGGSRRRARLVGVVVVAWLLLQLAIPTWRLLERGGAARPRTFGWQMFSHQLETPAERFYVVTDDGHREVDPAPLLTGPMRREVVYAEPVAEALCDAEDARAIDVHDAELGVRTFPC